MYKDFYRFTHNPFELSPDPRFYFASRGHNRAFAYLKYGIYQGDGFIVITGDIGAGKTTLVRTLMGELDVERIVAAQLVTTRLDADELVVAVAAAFGVPVEDATKAEVLARFETFLNSLGASKRRALLVVDEAQNLAPRAMEEMRMLSNFQIGARPLLQTFLVGQPELREMLRAPTMTQLRQRIIASYHLGPMGRDETRAYVLHRLERVGWQEDPVLDESIFAGIYEASGGLPRRINAICNRLFMLASLAHKHAIGPLDLEETVAEMREEIGPESRVVIEAHAGHGAAAGRPALPSALVARLERIEKNVDAAVELLEQIAGQTSRAAAPAPRLRPRFGARGGGPPQA